METESNVKAGKLWWDRGFGPQAAHVNDKKLVKKPCKSSKDICSHQILDETSMSMNTVTQGPVLISQIECFIVHWAPTLTHRTDQFSVLENLTLSAYLEKWGEEGKVLCKTEGKTTLPFCLWNGMITQETGITGISSFLHSSKLNVMMP